MYKCVDCNILFVFWNKIVFIDCLNFSESFNKRTALGRRFQARDDVYENDLRPDAVFINRTASDIQLTWYTVDLIILDTFNYKDNVTSWERKGSSDQRPSRPLLKKLMFFHPFLREMFVDPSSKIWSFFYPFLRHTFVDPSSKIWCFSILFYAICL